MAYITAGSAAIYKLLFKVQVEKILLRAAAGSDTTANAAINIFVSSVAITIEVRETSLFVNLLAIIG